MDDWTYGERYMGYKLPKYTQLIPNNDAFFLFYHNPSPFLIAMKDAYKEKIKFILSKQNKFYAYMNWGGYHYLSNQLVVGKKDSLSQNSNKEISTTNIDYLIKIVRFCESKQIKLILLRTPLYKSTDREFEKEYHNLLQTKLQSVECWDYVNFPIHDDEFADKRHLNYKGAKRFSKYINGELEKYFEKSK